MSPTPAPSADRRRLRTILRREREGVHMTQDQVAIAMDWSLSKVIRIESGSVSISTNDLRALLDLYQVNVPRQREELIGLARAARRPPWWAEYRDSLSPAFVYYIGLEPSAAHLRFFNNTIVPGLIQTRDYATAAIIGSAPEELKPETLETRLAVRMRRQQELFGAPTPPELTVVLDEAAVRRQVGGPAVLRGQLAHLIELAPLPNVALHVIPFERGAHPGTFGPYIIMDFPDPDVEAPVLLHDGAFDDMIREKPEAISTYRRSFDLIRAVALDPAETVDFLAAIRDSL
jgi:transcriptional regulator with XRE-family HTH domain